VPTREQVLRLLDAGLTYEQVGQRLAISPGLAYMIATGLPADGGDAVTARERNRPGYVAGSTQHLANLAQPRNPTGKPDVAEWIKQRVASDTQMATAAAAGDAATEPAAAAKSGKSSGKHVKTAKHQESA
jgi:hypothetical protein